MPGCGCALARCVPSHSSSQRSRLQVAAGVLESFTLSVAWSEMKREASKERLTPLQYLSRGSDPLNPAVLLEDSVAVVGVVVAGASIGLTAVRAASEPRRCKLVAPQSDVLALLVGEPFANCTFHLAMCRSDTAGDGVLSAGGEVAMGGG